MTSRSSSVSFVITAGSAARRHNNVRVGGGSSSEVRRGAQAVEAQGDRGDGAAGDCDVEGGALSKDKNCGSNAFAGAKALQHAKSFGSLLRAAT